MKKIIVLSFFTLLLAGCGSTELRDPLLNSKMAADQLGLASSDEVTISNTTEKVIDDFGSKLVTFDARTARGRNFICSYKVTAGLTFFDEASISDRQCKSK